MQQQVGADARGISSSKAGGRVRAHLPPRMPANLQAQAADRRSQQAAKLVSAAKTAPRQAWACVCSEEATAMGRARKGADKNYLRNTKGSSVDVEQIAKEHPEGDKQDLERPRYHVMSRRGWTSDPCGPMFHDGK